MDATSALAPTWRRRSVRLCGFDYRAPGAYFVTICTDSRALILGSVFDGTLALSPLGKLVDRAWMGLPDHFPCLELDAYVVMPNHLHGIVWLGDVSANQTQAQEALPRRFGDSVAGSLSTVVGGFKSASARSINEARRTVGDAVWQSGFHERVIRSERMLNAIRDYIANNPANWERDAENVRR